MLQELDSLRDDVGVIRQRQGATFPESAPAANPVFFRTYSRRTDAGLRETWDQVCDRTLRGLVELGKLTREEAAILDKMQRNMKSLPSGRWMWVCVNSRRCAWGVLPISPMMVILRRLRIEGS